MLELTREIQNRLGPLFEKGFWIKQEIDETGYDKQTVVLESPDCEILIDRVRGNFDVIVKSLVPTSVLIYPLYVFETYLSKNAATVPGATRGYYATYKDLQEVSTRLIERIDKIIELFKSNNQEQVDNNLRRIVRDLDKL